MLRIQKFSLLALALMAGLFGATPARAAESCYYSPWSYYPQRTYYYSKCYYEPPPAAVPVAEYPYHYCIYYPTTPKYCYYYHPVKKTYWGRYDLEAQAYSMLKEEDRKGSLKDIPESAFPKPGPLPPVPGAKEGVALVAPPKPPEAAPKDAPPKEPADKTDKTENK